MSVGGDGEASTHGKLAGRLYLKSYAKNWLRVTCKL